MEAALLLARRYWYVLVIAALCVLLGLQAVVNAGLRADVATLKAAIAKDVAARAKLVEDHEKKVGALERAAAAKQQENSDAFNQALQVERQRGAAESADNRRLRDKLAAATARDRSVGPTPATSCERDGDRLEALGQLAGEGVDLVGEARTLLRQRDLEVALLLSQIDSDRAACTVK